MHLLINSVRSFAGQHEICLRPLTLLVGENSAGKSTFLAMADAVLNRHFLSRHPKLNTAPYDLGSFDDLVSFLGGRSGRATRFSIGVRGDATEEDIRCTFVGEEGQPVLSRVEYSYLDTRFTLAFSNSKCRFTGQIGPETRTKAGLTGGTSDSADSFDVDIDFPDGGTGQESVMDWRLNVFQSLLYTKGDTPDAKKAVNPERALPLFSLPIFSGASRSISARSIAPVRTRPKRVYDAAQEQPDPEGDYIPFILARALSRRGAESDALKQALEAFGKESGLFTGIAPRRLSRKNLWPFQIEIQSGGPSKNMIDVGYGVSQALPIVVESLLAGPRTLLVQQPEVHLHPRAQAALGSFFAAIAATGRREFVIETHSDYLIDRVRSAVATGLLDPDKVMILFFHKPRSRTKVHELKIDRQGNVIDAPRTYRDFFLKEQLRMI